MLIAIKLITCNSCKEICKKKLGSAASPTITTDSSVCSGKWRQGVFCDKDKLYSEIQKHDANNSLHVFQTLLVLARRLLKSLKIPLMESMDIYIKSDLSTTQYTNCSRTLQQIRVAGYCGICAQSVETDYLGLTLLPNDVATKVYASCSPTIAVFSYLRLQLERPEIVALIYGETQRIRRSTLSQRHEYLPFDYELTPKGLAKLLISFTSDTLSAETSKFWNIFSEAMYIRNPRVLSLTETNWHGDLGEVSVPEIFFYGDLTINEATSKKPLNMTLMFP